MKEEAFDHIDKIKVAEDRFKIGKLKTLRSEKYGPTNVRLRKKDEVAAKFVQVLLKNKTLANL